MAILTIINGIPLFSTQAEAVAWGFSRGLVGSPTHNYQGETGYMGGISHSQALINNPNIVIEEDTSTEEDDDNINTSYSPPTGGGGY